MYTNLVTNIALLHYARRDLGFKQWHSPQSYGFIILDVGYLLKYFIWNNILFLEFSELLKITRIYDNFLHMWGSFIIRNIFIIWDSSEY
jgi:hypothetical protein